MFWRTHNVIFVIIALSLVIGSAIARPNKLQRRVSGVWGGEHISIEVVGRSALIEYDCARGTIDGPFTIDANGQFTWRGSYSREHGGPVRRDERSNAQQAVYKGRINRDTMTLKVTLANSEDSPGTFTLTRGQQGKVWKCK